MEDERKDAASIEAAKDAAYEAAKAAKAAEAYAEKIKDRADAVKSTTGEK